MSVATGRPQSARGRGGPGDLHCWVPERHGWSSLCRSSLSCLWAIPSAAAWPWDRPAWAAVAAAGPGRWAACRRESDWAPTWRGRCNPCSRSQESHSSVFDKAASAKCGFRRLGPRNTGYRIPSESPADGRHNRSRNHCSRGRTSTCGRCYPGRSRTWGSASFRSNNRPTSAGGRTGGGDSCRSSCRRTTSSRPWRRRFRHNRQKPGLRHGRNSAAVAAS